MNFSLINSGEYYPDSFNMIVEIPMESYPVKYEIDKSTGLAFVDRFILSGMRYPWNYGYIPGTLSDDGDPLDALILTPYPVNLGAVLLCRPIGLLKMRDEAGMDAKIIGVPCDKIYPPYKTIKDITDLSSIDKKKIQHFFEHYKDLEDGKWVEIQEWLGPNDARAEMIRSKK